MTGDAGSEARPDAPVDGTTSDAAPPGDGGGATPKPPADWANADFIDVHTHCGPSSNNCDGERCCDFSGWSTLQSTHQGRAVMLSNEYWRINEDIAPPEFKDHFVDLNDAYLRTAERESTAIAFAGLRCLYTEQVDDEWANKCKAEARSWVERGALGFKDHVGKQFESGDLESGYFIGGWNRFNGFCDVPATSTTPNSDCMQQPSVHYLTLEPAWREVVRYIIEELKVPIVSHASSYQKATTRCFDPEAGAVVSCAPLLIEQQIRLAEWLRDNTPPSATRRFVVAHTGFLTDDAAGLTRLLDTGVSTDTARFEAFADAGCAARALFAAYPKQIIFGTDRRVDQTCLPTSYDAFLHVFTGAAGGSMSFDTCWGQTAVQGMQLRDPVVAGCPDVPAGIVDRILRDNFLGLYE